MYPTLCSGGKCSTHVTVSLANIRCLAECALAGKAPVVHVERWREHSPQDGGLRVCLHASAASAPALPFAAELPQMGTAAAYLV